jgi:hypothetical protein
MFTPEEQQKIDIVKSILKSNFWLQVYKEILENRNVFISGGCFASLFWNEIPFDIDLFVLNNDYTKEMMQEQIQNAIANVDKKTIPYGTLIEIHYTAFKTLEEFFDYPDMMHSRLCYTFYDDTIHITRETYDAIMNKKIVPNNQPIPNFRVEKMRRRGWSI